MIVLLANNLYRGTTPHTAVVTLTLIAGLSLSHKQFYCRSEVKLGYAQIVALFSVLFALGYGIIGSYALRAQFNNLETWIDAVYFTFVTYSTLGFGDIHPLTAEAKIFVISMIPIGVGSFITAIATLLGPALEKRLKGVLGIMKKFQHITNHVIICGYSNVSESVIDELQERDVPFLIGRRSGRPGSAAVQ